MSKSPEYSARALDCDIDPVAIKLREKDQIELDMAGMTLRNSLAATKWTGSALYFGKDTEDVTAYLGMEYTEDSPVCWGIPWFLTDGRIFERHAKSFTQAAKKWLNWHFQFVHLLTNNVYAKHTGAIKWLRMLGFTVDTSKTWMCNGYPSYHFWQYSHALPPTWHLGTSTIEEKTDNVSR